MSLIENDFASGKIEEKVKTKPRNYSVSFKKKIIRELIATNTKIRDLANKYGLKKNTISAWKFLYAKNINKKLLDERKELLINEENGLIAQIQQECDKKIESKDREIENLYIEVGRLTIKLRLRGQ